jgi:DNA repair photolyase
MDYYSTPFSITSQFAFCGLPLRLDTYRGCGFSCSYCFARNRGGNLPDQGIRPANIETIRRVFSRSLQDGGPGVISEFLRRRIPIHLGGMSDPLQPAEERYQVTLTTLELLRQNSYPTVLSTRSALVIRSPYFELITTMHPLVVQF